MSDAKAKAVARQQRILAKSQARMAVALGEASVIAGNPSPVASTAPAAGAFASPTDSAAPERLPDAAAAAVSAPPQEEEYAQLGSSVESTQPAGGMTPKATGILARRRERIKALNNPQSPLAELLDADDALLEEASKECLGISAALADSKAGSINLACAGLSTPVSDTVEPAAADVDNIAVPTIAQHAAAQGIVKRSRYSRLSRASVLRLVNVGILLWISAVNGYNADVRVLDTRRDSGADTRLAELKSFLQPAAEELGVPLGVDADEFAELSTGTTFGDSVDMTSWSQSIYSFFHRLTTGVFENSIACVVIVHWFLAPKLVPFVENLLLVVGIVDADLFKSNSSPGGGVLATVFSLVMGGFSGIFASFMDIFSYMAFHFVFSISFSLLFGYYLKQGSGVDGAFEGSPASDL